MDCFARFGFPAPTFWETKDAMDCISALGISMAKFTILQATPYPEEASSPNLFTNAQSARKDSWVRNSWRARGSPIPRKRLHWELKQKSDFLMEKGSFFFSRMTIAHTTLTACAKTVARAAPAASRWSPATRNKSPKIFTIQATRTNKSGDLLSPSPRKIAESRL